MMQFAIISMAFASCSKDDSTTTPGDTIPQIPGYTLVWNDEFNGPNIDLTKWSHEVNGDGGGNNELQYYTNFPTNSFIQSGKLIVKAIHEDYQNRSFTSARFRSADKGDWIYGRIEISAKIPTGLGTWPAIWMLSTDWDYGGWPESGEIDIMEHVGYHPNIVHGSVHTLAYNHTIGTPKLLLFQYQLQRQSIIYTLSSGLQIILIFILTIQSTLHLIMRIEDGNIGLSIKDFI
ncbi:MAG: glycoside hydrolase family 16 protein [Ignavibacteriales bacterium]|nr:glycoside hydrolase family 16 protein [Ignavibacteriales bacterium]